MTEFALFGLIFTGLFIGLRILVLLSSLKAVFENLSNNVFAEKDVFEGAKKQIIEIVILLAVFFTIAVILFLFAYEGNT